MIVVPGNTIVFIDVDDTLIMWSPTQEELDQRGIEITCPASMVVIDDEIKPSHTWKAVVVPHRKHIEHLKRHKMRGHTVVVWSAGGFDWALAAVQALHLEEFVDIVISKPTWMIDDKKPEQFMPKPHWGKDE